MNTKGRKREQGFTLIEIIAVLIILGILAAVAIPKYIDMTQQAREKAAKGAIAEVRARYSQAYGKYLLVNNGTQPVTVSNILDDSNATSLGEDFSVSVSNTGTTNATITVGSVQGENLTPAVTGFWALPNSY
jgi:MSHA pilin protein MshA